MITKVKTDFLLSISEVKQHLRVDTSEEDGYILQIIKSAVFFAEQYIDKDIALTENSLILSDFSGSLIKVDEGNLVSITSLKDAVGTIVPYSLSERFDPYFIIETNSPVQDKTLTLLFKTGYTAETLPHSIKQAIFVKIGDLYDVDRNSYGIQVYQRSNNAFESLLNYFVAKRTTYIKN